MQTYTEKDIIPNILQCHIWKNVKAHEIIIERIKHAFTNRVFVCTDAHKNKVVVRLRCQTQQHPHPVALCPDAPNVLWQHENVIVEEFIPYPCMSNDQIRQHPHIIAPLLARFHKANPIPQKSQSYIWDTIFASLDSFVVSRDVVQTLYEHVTTTCKPWMTLCHNDVHHGNILFDPITQKAFLIDYDYVGVNHVAYDIANHWCEYMYDYIAHDINECFTENFPNTQEQIRFIELYLEAYGASERVLTVKELHDCVLAHIPVCHLFWALWGFKNGYISFAQKRLCLFCDFCDSR